VADVALIPPLVLICDDEAALRSLIRATLSEGYGFVEASDGDEALERALEHGPDAIILDMMMPKRTGLEVLAAVRDTPRLRETPILMLTARVQAADRMSAAAAGADAFLAKPFSPLELLAVMKKLLPLR
jgi:CheY-like chemotaxis protein